MIENQNHAHYIGSALQTRYLHVYRCCHDKSILKLLLNIKTVCVLIMQSFRIERNACRHDLQKSSQYWQKLLCFRLKSKEWTLAGRFWAHVWTQNHQRYDRDACSNDMHTVSYLKQFDSSWSHFKERSKCCESKHSFWGHFVFIYIVHSPPKWQTMT